MVDGVADQVDHRVAEPLDDRPVEPRVLTDDPQLDLLAGAVGQVADHPREPREELVDRDHPQVERRVADLPADPLERLERVHPGLDARESRGAPGGCRRARRARRPGRPGRRAGRRRPGSGRAAAAAGARGRPGAGAGGSGPCGGAAGIGGGGGRRAVAATGRRVRLRPGGRDRLRRARAVGGRDRRPSARSIAAVVERGTAPVAVGGPPLDRDRAVFGDEQEDVVEPLRRRRRSRPRSSRPGSTARGRARRAAGTELRVGARPRVSPELAELVEHAERVDPPPEDVGPGRERDPVDVMAVGPGRSRRRRPRPAGARRRAHLRAFFARGPRLRRPVRRRRPSAAFGPAASRRRRSLGARAAAGRRTAAPPRGGPTRAWRAGAAGRRAGAAAAAAGAPEIRGAGRLSRWVSSAEAGIGRPGRLGLDHRREVVARFEQRRDDVGVDRQRAGADPVEDGLDAVGELGDGRQARPWPPPP